MAGPLWVSFSYAMRVMLLVLSYEQIVRDIPFHWLIPTISFVGAVVTLVFI